LRLGQQDAGEVPVFHELRNRLRAVDNLAGLKVDKDIVRYNAAVGGLKDGFERPAIGANVVRSNKHVFGVEVSSPKSGVHAEFADVKKRLLALQNSLPPICNPE
jgi:hypothetical protein